MRQRPDFSQLRRAWAFTGPWRGRLALGMVAVIFSSLLTLALPLLARTLFNDAFTADPGAEGRLNLILYGMLAASLFTAGFNFLRVYSLGVAGEGIVADMRRTVFGHILTLSFDFFESRKVGEITSRLTSDVAAVQSAMSQGIAQLTSQLVTLTGGVIVLFFINTRLTLLMLAVVPVVIVAAAFFGRYLRGLSTRFQDAVAAASAQADEAIASIRVVKSFVAEGAETRRYGGLIGESFRLARRRSLGRALFIPSVGFAMFSGIAFVLWFGGREVLAGQLLPGDLVAFLILTITVAASVGAFTELYSQLQEAIGASSRIFELLDLRPGLDPAADEPPLGQVRGQVELHGVSFAYPDSGPVLHDVSLVATPGTVTALVGPSGAGKSTLAMLIPRFHDPVSGHITLDGRDLRHIPLDDLRSVTGVVFQETQLFSGPVLENIRYGRPDASLEEVLDAARAANALGFIEALPEGLETTVGERGIKLSGGQRQRIAIARALLKDPRILILDEATSSLDNESEALVQEALETLMRGRTTFVIAHRLSTIREADQILVLEGGRLVQTGTHDQLIGVPGLYRTLHERSYSRTDASMVK